jgi:hypothetical protein
MKALSNAMNKQTPPTMRDIADILTEIAPPGEKQEEKQTTIKRLFEEIGGGVNPQGHSTWDDLENYKEY